MKAITRLGIGVALVLLVAPAFQPANAACPATDAPLIEFAGAYLVSNPTWCGPGGTGQSQTGCYDSNGGPPVSDKLDGFFWAQTAPNEALLAGADNGDWGVDRWVKQISDTFSNGLYHYPAFISVNDDAYPYQPGTAINWASSNLIDGCVHTDVTPPTRFDECQCMLLTDEIGGQGYFAMLSKFNNAAGNFIFSDQAGTIYNMAPIPKPEITGSSRNATTGSVTFNINVPTPTGGDFRDLAGGCDCGFGFRVFAAVMGEGGMAPSTRSACTQRALFEATGQNLSYSDPGFQPACRAAGFVWVPADNAGGGTQPVTGFNGGRATSSVTVTCGNPSMGFDLYLSTSIGADDGPSVQVSNVSQNSFQVKCGNYTLADPNRPERPEAAPGRSGDAPRGRDTDRGNRER